MTGRWSLVVAMLPVLPLTLALLPGLLAQAPPAPPAPPDRLWFRQDSLGPGQTCEAEQEKIKVGRASDSATD